MAAMVEKRDGQGGIRLTPEQKKRQRARSIAIGLAVALLCALFYAITIVKLGPGVLSRGP